jgi:F-type H+-transporting ATPase subunit b
LQQAEQKSIDAKERLAEAKAQLEMAQSKSEELKEQGKTAAEREKAALLKQTEEEIFRLKEAKQDSIRLQQQKAVAQISEKVLTLALEEVSSRLEQGLDKTNHNSIINYGLVEFSNYRLYY